MARRILVVDDDPTIRSSFTEVLADEETEVCTAASAEEALAAVDAQRPDLVLSDVRMPGLDGIELLRLLKERAPRTDVIIMTAYDDMPTAVAAMREGAFDFLPKPLDLDALRRVLDRLFDDRRVREHQRRAAEDAASRYQLDQLVGRDPGMIESYKLVGQLAANRASVLIRGETGYRQGIYRIEVQTGEHAFAHTIEGNMRGAAWVDDGRTVVYKEAGVGARVPQWCRFVTVELSSSREREVYRWPCFSKDWWWTLSPDRRTIAGMFDPAENPGENPWTLRLVSLSDGASRDLAEFNPVIGDNAAGPAMFPELSWTPDSRAVHTRGCSSRDQLIEALNRCPNWAFDVETGERRRLADEAPIGWIHRDGRRVAFAHGDTAYEIWVMEGYLPSE